MIDLPTYQQWKALFSIAKKIRYEESWQQYKQHEIFAIHDVAEDEPVFCSILGSGNEFFGVSLYKGYKSLRGFFKILKAGEDPPFYTIIGNKECLTLYFGNKNALGPGDYSAMEYGEYVPENGPFNQIFFRTYTPGMAPWYIDATECSFMETYLTHFFSALKEVEHQEPPLHIDDENILTYTNENGVWQLCSRPLPPLDTKDSTIEIRDELFLAKLKKLPRTSLAMELESTFLTNPIAGKHQIRPIFPRICICANHDEGSVEKQLVLDEEDNYVEALFNILIESMKEKGRPRLLIIRKGNINHLIKDLCEKINIPIEERHHLEIIDDFLNVIGNYYPEK